MSNNPFANHLIPEEYYNEFTDEEFLNLGIKSEDLMKYRIFNFELKVDLKLWYEPVKDYTYRTEILNLTNEEVECLLNRMIEIDRHSFDDDKKKSKEFLDLNNRRDILEGIEKKIDDIIKEKFSENGCFIKTPLRSPKDVPTYSAKKEWLKDFDKVIDKIKITNYPEQLLQYSVAITKALKCTSGSDAMFLLCSSSRVKSDLRKFLKFPKHQAYLVLREFDDAIVRNPGEEFRGFVYNSKLTALSQYNTFEIFKETLSKKDYYQKLITEFWEKELKEKIPIKHYVVDFYVTEEKVIMIEVNPFFMGTGACNFNWAKDYTALKNGPFQFRMTETQKYHGQDLVDMYFGNPWRKLIFQKRQDHQKKVRNQKIFLLIAVLIVVFAILIKVFLVK
ncbi:cell division cycle protein 123 [Anaeramoeba flamelloides]|uniref:Cell division cycle protein 123 n=1 Tax=Anaeramoeba flamelloides TaxID=1746091 RepID=A0AAV7YQF3_9EUKA|nr:cell division cycle protein 123 [Anaeramoeba flamelloides]